MLFVDAKSITFKIILKQVNRELNQKSLSHKEISVNRNNLMFVIKEQLHQTLINFPWFTTYDMI